jgi:uncharacterized lipoprotein YddW (UPF0748 family)
VDPDVTQNRHFIFWPLASKHKKISGFLALSLLGNAFLPVCLAESLQAGTSFQPNVSPYPGIVIRERQEQGVFGSRMLTASKLPPMNPPSLTAGGTESSEASPSSNSSSKKTDSKKAEEDKKELSAKSKPHQSTSATEGHKHFIFKHHLASPHKATEAETDSEVINNILGAPVVTPPKPSTDPTQTAPGVEQKTDSTTPSKAGETTTTQAETSQFPEPSHFDYGIYTYNCHLLDNYVQRVRNGLQLAQELGLSRPKKQIEDLLKKTQEHRRLFTDKYPSPKLEESQAGLLAYEEARQNVLEALALASVSPRVEGRAIWLDRASIVQAGSPEGLKSLLARLNHAGINIIYFETVNAGFSIYPSKITKSNPLINNWDPLAVAVEEGHRLGMEVHAWVWAFAVGNRRHNALINQPETYPGPILNDLGLITEALRNKHGGLAVDGRQHEFWLSPASQKAKDFLLSLYSEIVSNYAVDGLHLDYIRYPFQTSGTRMGYEAAGRTAYHATTGKSVDDTGTDSMRLWAAWKTVQVSNFVRDVSSTLRPLRPGLKISAAVFPMRRASRLAAIQQDWETWVEQGWVDTLSPMSYTSDPQRLKSLYESVVSSPQLHTLVYPGIALGHLDNGQLFLQLEALREKGSLGSTLFAATHLSPEKAEALSAGPFHQNKVLVPHRDILKSASTAFTDYEDIVTRLSSYKTLGSAPPIEITEESLHALKRNMDAFSVSLNKLQSYTVASEAGPQHVTLDERVGDVLYNLSALQQTHLLALEKERVLHPLRADYLDKELTQLKNLLTIYSDHALLEPSGVQTAHQSKLAPVSVNSAFHVLATKGRPSNLSTGVQPSHSDAINSESSSNKIPSTLQGVGIPTSSSPSASKNQ